MSAKGSLKLGLLSMVVAAGLFTAANGFTADAHTTTKFEGVKANSGITCGTSVYRLRLTTSGARC
jgi:hypothetical protein